MPAALASAMSFSQSSFTHDPAFPIYRKSRQHVFLISLTGGEGSTYDEVSEDGLCWSVKCLSLHGRREKGDGCSQEGVSETHFECGRSGRKNHRFRRAEGVDELESTEALDFVCSM